MRPAASLWLMVVLLGSPGSALDSRTAARWQFEMATASEELRGGQYEQALPRLEKLVDQMVERLGPGDEEAELFSFVVVLRSIAHEGLGDREQALWYWQVAQGIDPEVVQADLSAFGAPGEFLKNHPLAPHEPVTQAKGDGALRATEPVFLTADITTPAPITVPRPAYPSGARAFNVEGPLVLRVVIDREGLPREPRLLEALPAPTLSYTALEAVKRWRFKPAMRAGEPVAVYYSLTINFHLER